MDVYVFCVSQKRWKVDEVLNLHELNEPIRALQLGSRGLLSTNNTEIIVTENKCNQMIDYIYIYLFM